jgi:DNA-binding transcriptional ArsR family regulator
MNINIPSSSKKDVKLKLSLVNDKISKAILKNLLKKNPKFFNELIRDMTKAGIGSRRSVYIRLSKLEDGGLIESEMEPQKINNITHWVKRYRVVLEHKPWLKDICS